MADAITVPIYTVPKIVHVTYSSLDDLPEDLRSNLHAWQDLGWDVHFHSTADNVILLSSYYPDLLSKYNSYSEEQKTIFMKYVYVHKYGGVVVNCNVKPLTDIYNDIQQEVSLCYSLTFTNYVTTDFLAGSPGHPFWMDVLGACRSPNGWLEWISPLQTSYCVGSYVLSSVFKNTKHPVRTVPQNWLGCNECTTTCTPTVLSVTTKADSVWTVVYCYRKEIGVAAFLFCICIVGILSMNISSRSIVKHSKNSYF